MFWRRQGIRCEASASCQDGIITRRFYTFESVIAYGESLIRGMFTLPKLVPFRIVFPQMVSSEVSIPSPYLFAIAFDATGGKREASGGTPNTISFTVTGSNNVLIANTSTFTDDVTDCDYAGVNLTDTAAKINGVDAVLNGVDLRYLIAPATGTNNLVTTDNGSGSLAVAVANYTGAKQTSPIDSTSTASETSASSITGTTTVVASGCWLVMGGAAVVSDMAAGSGTTTRQTNQNYALCDSNASVSTGAQSLILTYTSGAARAAILSLAPAAAATSIKTVNGLAYASVKTVNGLAVASIKNINGLA